MKAIYRRHVQAALDTQLHAVHGQSSLQPLGARRHALHSPDPTQCSVDPADPNFVKIFIEEDAMLVTEDQARVRAEAAVTTCLKDPEDVAIPYLNQWIESRRPTG